jgi:1-acylglycerone phosphate reductase
MPASSYQVRSGDPLALSHSFDFGVYGTGPLIDQSLDDVKRIFDTNTHAILRMAKAVIPVMAKRQSGVIVNIGSIVGEL